MNRDEMMGIFRDLARSQGFYGRLIEAIEEVDSCDREDFWDELEAQNFRDAVDLVIYLEC